MTPESTTSSESGPTPEAILAALEPDSPLPPEVVQSRALSLSFGSKRVLSDVDLAIRRGAVTALIGPTGCGKTTLLRTINRLNDQVTGFCHDGELTLDGESIWDLDRGKLRRRVGMLFQRPNPFPMSIKDNVVAGVKAQQIASGRQLDIIVEERLHQVGLWDSVKDRLSESPFRLSGGQQQLLCLARVLAVGPEVVLLDEPTSALDPISTEWIESLLRALATAFTIVIVTHNLGQAHRVSDDTVFLFGGSLVEAGPTRELFDHPRRPLTERYISGHIG